MKTRAELPTEPKVPLPPDLPPDVATPSDARAVELVVNKGVARALELATSAKDLTGVIEAATEWYKAAYGSGAKEAGWGADLPQNGATRHGA